ncbi:polysaccharide biosynthesis/export family protein [Marinigracilibium pacificum]|uniref:Polysaccharide export protein EpsE n=1 Tax=Marinigracilibium pacificum TaxID=2729599 RepID=A0A848IVS8_9BACT|nr:polysaccharide biosynthesis/export family protein [Marinigracilibium pacificum]NMM47385.1 polysaccharide export protein EpsE [Marinigracilibium pacificum]
MFSDISADESSPYLKLQANNTISQYRLEAFDRITVDVYTNEGERIIDPDLELIPETAGQGIQSKPRPEYVVQSDGYVRLPMIGRVYALGLTLEELNQLLADEYSEFYFEPYVLSSYANKRVVVLGAPGGQVVPLLNENTNLLEILALAGGISSDMRADNIRLIRGDLNNPEVFLIDLSTIEGMTKAQTRVESGDIIYIEPVVRPANRAFRDAAPFVGTISGILTIILIFTTNL